MRRFAEGMGLEEKTDAIDAGLIAWFAEVKRSRPSSPPGPDQRHRRAPVTRLRQLTQLRVAQRNQRRLITDATVLASIDALLRLVESQIETLETDIAARIDRDPLWRELDAAFRSIKGVAGRTVARLMAETPEIGAAPNKAISKLAESPLWPATAANIRAGAVRGGRAAVREILFVVASVAGRYEPDFMAFRQRLAEAGKPPKVIRIALAHKLLVRLNAKAREVRQRQAALSRPSNPSAAEALAATW